MTTAFREARVRALSAAIVAGVALAGFPGSPAAQPHSFRSQFDRLAYVLGWDTIPDANVVERSATRLLFHSKELTGDYLVSFSTSNRCQLDVMLTASSGEKLLSKETFNLAAYDPGLDNFAPKETRFGVQWCASWPARPQVCLRYLSIGEARPMARQAIEELVRECRG